MNYQQKRQRFFKLNDLIIQRKFGCIYHKQNEDAHEDWKWHIYKKLKNTLGNKNIKNSSSDYVFTEPLVKGKFGKTIRPDLLAIDFNEGIGIIIEILNSETEKQFEQKIKYYPDEYEIIKVKAGEEPELPF